MEDGKYTIVIRCAGEGRGITTEVSGDSMGIIAALAANLVEAIAKTGTDSYSRHKLFLGVLADTAEYANTVFGEGEE